MKCWDKCGLMWREPELRVAVISGGDTPEFDASMSSGFNVYNKIRQKFLSVLVVISNGQWSLVEPVNSFIESPLLASGLWFKDELTGAHRKPDIAILCTHGSPGESGELQGWLEINGIPYCSSGVLASALTANKHYCNQYLGHVHGMRVPNQRWMPRCELQLMSETELSLMIPFVLKPSSLGSSLGVMSIHDALGVAPALSIAASMNCDYVIEEFLSGREITAAAFHHGGKTVIFPPGTVIRNVEADQFGIMRYSDHKSTDMIMPADVDLEVLQIVEREMNRLRSALSLSGFFRADFIWTGNELYFLEVNTVPGLSESSAFTRLARHAGYELYDLLERMIQS